MRFTLTQTVLAATLGLGLAAAPALAQDKSNAGAMEKGMDRAGTAAGDHGMAGRENAATQKDEAMSKKDAMKDDKGMHDKGKPEKASKDMKDKSEKASKDMKDKSEKMDKKMDKKSH
ncbi:MAG: hypothetical protein AB7G39_05350 [Alphaproteobacteria bacterium]